MQVKTPGTRLMISAIGYGILWTVIVLRRALERLIPLAPYPRDQNLISLVQKFYPRYTSGFQDAYAHIFWCRHL